MSVAFGSELPGLVATFGAARWIECSGVGPDSAEDVAAASPSAAEKARAEAAKKQ